MHSTVSSTPKSFNSLLNKNGQVFLTAKLSACFSSPSASLEDGRQRGVSRYPNQGCCVSLQSSRITFHGSDSLCDGHIEFAQPPSSHFVLPGMVEKFLALSTFFLAYSTLCAAASSEVSAILGWSTVLFFKFSTVHGAGLMMKRSPGWPFTERGVHAPGVTRVAGAARGGEGSAAQTASLSITRNLFLGFPR